MSNWSIKQRMREDILEAVEKGNVSKVEELLDKGADVNESEGGYLSKKTLLLVAIENSNEIMARLLVDRGADLTITVTVSGKKKSLAELAKDKELQSLSEYIQYKKDVNDRFVYSIQEGNIQDVQEGINRGSNLKQWYSPPELSKPDCTLLQLALIQGHLDVAKLLITSGVDLHSVMKWEDQREDTARSYAERMNYDDIVTLIDKSAKEQNGDIKKQVPNGTSHGQTNSNKTTGNNDPDVLDIEDVDHFQEDHHGTPVETKKQKTKDGNCTVS